MKQCGTSQSSGLRNVHARYDELSGRSAVDLRLDFVT